MGAQNNFKDDWSPYFFPKTFVKENKDISIDQFALTENGLKDLGI